MPNFTNRDGLVQFYGPRGANDTPVARQAINDGGQEKIIELDVKFDQIGSTLATFVDQDANGDGVNDSFSGSHAYIPANSVITDAKFYVKDAFTSGGAATLGVGLYQRSGTAIDAAGIISAQAVAGLTAGACIVGGGALATNDSVGANDAYVGMVFGTAAFTAGSGRLVVRYVPRRP